MAAERGSILPSPELHPDLGNNNEAVFGLGGWFVLFTGDHAGDAPLCSISKSELNPDSHGRLRVHVVGPMVEEVLHAALAPAPSNEQLAMLVFGDVSEGAAKSTPGSWHEITGVGAYEGGATEYCRRYAALLLSQFVELDIPS